MAKKMIIILILCAALLILSSSPGAAEEVWAEVDGHTVQVFHFDAYYQCAAEVVIEIESAEHVIALLEFDIGPPADCMCYFDLKYEFEVEETGEYLLQVWNCYGVLIAEIPIVIADGNLWGNEIQVLQSGCGGWATDIITEPEIEPGTWSLVKQLYR